MSEKGVRVEVNLWRTRRRSVPSHRGGRNRHHRLPLFPVSHVGSSRTTSRDRESSRHRSVFSHRRLKTYHTVQSWYRLAMVLEECTHGTNSVSRSGVGVNNVGKVPPPCVRASPVLPSPSRPDTWVSDTRMGATRVPGSPDFPRFTDTERVPLRIDSPTETI